MRIRPRRNDESLVAYGEAAARQLLAHAKDACDARGPHAVWEEIFNAICHEGRYVREVSPAAVVIYQRYLCIAADYLKEYPDSAKREILRARVEADLAEHEAEYLMMKKANPFTGREFREGSRAISIVKRTLKSFA